MFTALEHAPRIVLGDSAFDGLGEIGFLCKRVDIDGVEKITAIVKTLDLIGLVFVGFSGQIPGIG